MQANTFMTRAGPDVFVIVLRATPPMFTLTRGLEVSACTAIYCSRSALGLPHDDDDGAHSGIARSRTGAGDEHHAARARLLRVAHAACYRCRAPNRIRPAVRRSSRGR